MSVSHVAHIRKLLPFTYNVVKLCRETRGEGRGRGRWWYLSVTAALPGIRMAGGVDTWTPALDGPGIAANCYNVI